MFTITPVKGKENQFVLKGNLTKGQLISLRNSLKAWGSTIATELKTSLDKAAESAKLTLKSQ